MTIWWFIYIFWFVYLQYTCSFSTNYTDYTKIFYYYILGCIFVYMCVDCISVIVFDFICVSTVYTVSLLLIRYQIAINNLSFQVFTKSSLPNFRYKRKLFPSPLQKLPLVLARVVSKKQKKSIFEFLGDLLFCIQWGF